MSLQSHVQELRRKHEALSREIESESQRPASNDFTIAELKRRKLHLKDEIRKLSDA